MYILIKYTDFYDSDNVEGRLQTKKFESYNEAFEEVKNEVTHALKCDDDHYLEYLDKVLEGWEFSNVCIDKYAAFVHTDYGNFHRYWKIVEI